MADTTKAAVADAPASHCSPAWSALIHDEDRIRTISPQELMPIFQGMMKGGCKACPKGQTTACQNLEKPFVVLGHDVVRSMFSMPWEFKAEDIIAGGASDASVRHADIRRVIQHIEGVARANGSDAVSLADAAEGLATLGGDFAYRSPGEVEPEFTRLVAGMAEPWKVTARGRAESRERAAAFRSNPAAAMRNAEGIKQALPYEAAVHDALASRELNWCNHVPHLFTRMMTRVHVDDAAFAAMLDASEAVARERQHHGVTPRDVETALMRSAAAGASAGDR